MTNSAAWYVLRDRVHDLVGALDEVFAGVEDAVGHVARHRHGCQGHLPRDRRRKPLECVPPCLLGLGGEILLPGRWWAHAFERVGDWLEGAGELRQAAGARQLAREASFPDVALPADTDTIAFLSPVDGELVVHEALPPNGVIRVRLTAEPPPRN